MSASVRNAIVMACAVLVAFVFAQSTYARYDIQVSAVIFILYFFLKKFPSLSAKISLDTHRLIDSVIFTVLVTSLINTTGGLQSPLFFLYYFLIFAVSLILEPSVSLSTTTAVVVLYLLFGGSIGSVRDYIPLISLPFLTPFALFLGTEYQKLLIEQNQIRLLTKKNTDLTTTIRSEEENTFLFLSLVMRSRLRSIRESVENFMGDAELENIDRQVSEMEKFIDSFESSQKS